VLARFRKLPALFLDFIEQARVLHSNPGLVGERRRQFYLLLGERFHHAAEQNHYADRPSFTQHRDGKRHAVAGPSLNVGERVFRIGQHIGDLHRPGLDHRAPYHTAAGLLHADVSHNVFFDIIRLTEGRKLLVTSTLLSEHHRRNISLAQAGSRLDKCIENHLQVERRAADDLEHVGGRGLLRERLGKAPLRLDKMLSRSSRSRVSWATFVCLLEAEGRRR
jgi:hypothetical protein